MNTTTETPQAAVSSYPGRGESVAQQAKFTDDWDNERKKQKILSLILIAVMVVVVVLFIVSMIR